MSLFHVFVEGPRDPSKDAVQRLAEAMARRYGLPASELTTRLTRGRFRVKANVDRATADAYIRDLGALGARVVVEPVDGAGAGASTASATPAHRPSGSMSGASTSSSGTGTSSSGLAGASPSGLTGTSPSGEYRASRPTSDPIPMTNVRVAGARTSAPPMGTARSTSTATSSSTSTPPSGIARMTVRGSTPPAGVATDDTRVATTDPRAATTDPSASQDDDELMTLGQAGNPRATPPSGTQPLPRTATPAARTATPPTGTSLSASRTATPVPSTQPLPRTGSNPPPSRTATPASGLAAAGAVAPSHRPSHSSGLAAAGHADPAPRPSNPSGLAAAAGALAAGRAPSSSLPPTNVAQADASAPAGNFASGLSAAFTGEIPLDLGALGDGQALSLASVDGESEEPPTVGELDPPSASDEPMLAASFGPPPSTPPPSAKREPSGRHALDKPTDLFAPPEASEDVPLDFAIDDDAHRGRASTPPDNVAVPIAATSQPLSAVKSQQLAPMRSGAVAISAKSEGKQLTRGRFAAGVVLALVLGFVPAHFVAAMQEKSAYSEIDGKVRKYQADPTVGESEVESFRAGQIDAKRSKRTMIALTSMLVWAAVSAAAAYVYFRRLPWDQSSPSPSS